MKKKIRVVVDTNIFVSALLGGETAIKLIPYLEGRAFFLLLSEFLLKELKEVLTYKGLSAIAVHDVERLLKTLSLTTEIVRSTSRLELSRDPEDNKVIEAAVDGKADVLVTGDRDLLVLKSVEGIPIITLREFLRLLSE